MRSAALAALLVLTGCGEQAAPQAAGSSGPVRRMPSPEPGWCGAPGLDDKQVAFTDAGGVWLTGYVLGTGSTAVVLAAQAAASACSWLAWANRLAAAGYRVLAFDFSGEGRSQRGPASTFPGDVEAATGYARGLGVAKVVLVGASRGGTAVLVAAARVAPPVSAVVSLSAPEQYQGMNAGDAAPKLTVPVLYVAATGDGPFSRDARSLHGVTPGGRKTLTLVPGSLHGEALMLIDGEGAAEAVAAVDAFLHAA